MAATKSTDPAAVLSVAPARPPRPRKGFKLTWTAARKKAMESYVALMASQLGLRDWEVLIEWEPMEDCCAAVAPVYGQKRATLHFGPNFLNAEGAPGPAAVATWQRQTIVHELIHLHLYPLTEGVSRTNAALLSEEAATVAGLALGQSCEYATDGLADAVAGFFPLPDLS